MTKIALLGFPQVVADHSATIAEVMQVDTDAIRVFSELRAATQFLVSKVPGTNTLTGQDNFIFIFESHDKAEVDSAETRLPSIGLTVVIRDTFGAAEPNLEAVREWVTYGTWPEKVEADTGIDDLLDSFLSGDVSVSAQQPVDDAPTPIAAEQEPATPPVVATNHVGGNHDATEGFDQEELDNSATADSDIPLPLPQEADFSSLPAEPVQVQEFSEPEFALPPVVEVPDAPLPVYQDPGSIIQSPAPLVIHDIDEPDAPLPVQTPQPNPAQVVSDSLDGANQPAPLNVPAPESTEPHALGDTSSPPQLPEQEPNFDDLIGGATPVVTPPVAVQPPVMEPAPAPAATPDPVAVASGEFDDLAPIDIRPDQVRQASPLAVDSVLVPPPEQPVFVPQALPQQAPAPAPLPEPELIPIHIPVSMPAVQESEPTLQQSPELTPQESQTQSILEEQMQMFAQTPAGGNISRDGGVVHYITGSHGGTGKSTVSYMLANVVARAIAQEAKDSGVEPKEVWLIESDFENSKLAERLNAKSGNDSGYMAKFLKDLSARQSATVPNLPEIRATVIEQTVIRFPSGLNVVVCPYDPAGMESRYMQAAIFQIVEYARSRGAYVFVDASTMSAYDPLDRKLAGIADKIILVTDSGHLQDVSRDVKTMVTSIGEGGFGVQIARINVFLNRTGRTTYDKILDNNQFKSLPINGFVPVIPEWNDQWVGDQERGANFVDAVARFAMYINKVTPISALKRWEQYKLVVPKKGKTKQGFFGRKTKKQA